MNANPKTIVNSYNSYDFITWQYYELGSLNSLDSDFLDLHMNEFSKGSARIDRPMHGRIVWEI